MKRALWIVLPLSFVSCEAAPAVKPQAPAVGDSRNLEQFELKKACFDIGRRLYEAEFKHPGGGQVALNPLYTYSKELNTCVMFGGFVGKDQTSFFLVDALSNVELASSIRAGGETIGLSREEFDRKKKAFFPEVP
jgi:hypothetical protein